MPRRLTIAFVSVVCFAASLGQAAEVEFLRVWPGWRNAEAFDRIGEYFGRGENTGRQRVMRTHADSRAGFYFLVRVKSASVINDAKFELNVIRPDHPEPKVHAFTTNIPQKETVFQLGLTGSDWPGGENTNPVAWKLALLAPDGRVLAEHKSFLWEKPAK
jgi:hypothetical protein